MAEMNPGQTWECEQKLPLPIGVSNYCLAASEYYYIDEPLCHARFLNYNLRALKSGNFFI